MIALMSDMTPLADMSEVFREREPALPPFPVTPPPGEEPKPPDPPPEESLGVSLPTTESKGLSF